MKKYYKCKSHNYNYFTKGYIYSEDNIDNRILTEDPKDWQLVSLPPNFIDLVKAIKTGENKEKVLKALKQWKNNRIILK